MHAILDKLPTLAKCQRYTKNINSMAAEIYRYLNFDQIEEFQKSAKEGKRIAAAEIQVPNESPALTGEAFFA